MRSEPEETITNTGAIVYSIPIRVPPGRIDQTPALELRYSSEDTSPESPVAFGWSVPHSAVRRNTKHGMPPLRILPDGRHVYRSDVGIRPFDLDGVQLDHDSDASADYFPSVGADGTVARFVESADYWIVQERNGHTKYYGRVPDGSFAPAVLQDERGTREWALVRDVDAFGNAIDYQYVESPPRTSMSQPQLDPLIARVRYGANINSGLAHFAEVAFQYPVVEQVVRDLSLG